MTIFSLEWLVRLVRGKEEMLQNRNKQKKTNRKNDMAFCVICICF